jgi:hypothetical protein
MGDKLFKLYHGLKNNVVPNLPNLIFFLTFFRKIDNIGHDLVFTDMYNVEGGIFR